MFDIAPDAAFDHHPDAGTRNRMPAVTYPLLHCPPLAQGLDVALIGVDDAGGSVELGRYVMLSPEPIENLARIRFAAVHAGASEIAILR